jgi:hypothetical protein
MSNSRQVLITFKLRRLTENQCAEIAEICQFDFSIRFGYFSESYHNSVHFTEVVILRSSTIPVPPPYSGGPGSGSDRNGSDGSFFSDQSGLQWIDLLMDSATDRVLAAMDFPTGIPAESQP